MVTRSLVVALLGLTTAAFASAQSSVSFETYGDNARVGNGSMVAGDFNNDGKPDLIQCCNSSTQLVFRAGNGDGTFQAPVVAFSTPVSTNKLIAVDVNGDGKLDLVSVAALNPPAPPGSGNAYLTVWPGNGDGTFQAPQQYTTTQGPGTALVGNFFNDGRPDIAVSESSSTIDLFRNNGNGTFTFVKSLNTGGGYYGEIDTVAGDFNGNGISDLAVMQLAGTSNGVDFASPQQLYVLWNDGKGNFTQQQFGGDYNFPQLAVARLNGDAMMDLIVSYKCAPSYPDNYCVAFDGYYGQGNNQLYKRTLVNDSSGVNPGDMGQLAGVDINGDGYGDIVAVGALQCNTSDGTCNPGSGSVGYQGLFVWLGNADGSFQQTSQQFFTSDEAQLGSMAMADFNRDGMMDFAQAVPGGGTSPTEFYINATQRTACGKYTINPTVTVCQPVDNTYSPSPVRVQANSFDTTQVTAMQEYVDYQLVYSQPVTSFNTSFNESPGTHLFVTKAWDASGLSFVADRNITVYDGIPGPVCPAAPDSAAICLPSGSSSGSPVVILANGNPGSSISAAAQLYIDNQLVVDDESQCSGGNCFGADSFVQTLQNLSSGTHNLVFKIWTMSGNVYEAQKTISVD